MKFVKPLQGMLHHHYSLAPYTSWHVGGPAEHFYEPANLQDLQCFLQTLSPHEPLTCIGLGSNLLIRDAGIKGTVILTLGALNELTQIDPFTIRAEAGVPCAKLSKLCVKLGFEDGAFFAGIPGTVGGALRMNAGAFGGETWPHVVEIETINHRGKIEHRPPNTFQFAYRHVDGLAENEFFAAAHFRFTAGNSERAKMAIKELLQKRQNTQPIGTFNCGSVFRNPPNDFAARLIEAAGLKGTVIGDAEVSQKHANFIINRGNASAADIENLIQLVQDRVLATHHVQLIRECIIVGERS